ncbi:hypothetical protein XENORESO_019116 [Xenotaenia resolanae]|uniref:Uncharacterized protein n=1 Tax=Xenotaenia resolanae TaxID=208358 RepID=A0ABV0W670_9TELE
MFVDMLCCQRLQHCVDLCLGFFLFIAGLQQVEAAAADSEMANLNWKPFIYGGMASIVAEFGFMYTWLPAYEICGYILQQHLQSDDDSGLTGELMPLNRFEDHPEKTLVNTPFKIQLHFNLCCYFLSSGTFPIDLTKTRLQVQGQSQYTEVRYRGMFHALFRIGKEEGIRALYSGYAAGIPAHVLFLIFGHFIVFSGYK